MQSFGQIRLERAGQGAGERSMQAQLADQLKAIIRSGRVKAGEKLPSTRALGEQLQVSRNTVVAAYDSLQAEGYVQASERRAFVVSKVVRAFLPNPQPSRPLRQVRQPLPPVAPVPFRPAQPDVNLFSMQVWNRHRNRVLKRGSSLLHYQARFSMGLDELRQNVAAYLRDSRGVRCRWDEIAITGGSQQALFLLGHLLLERGRSVYMEDPGYPGARRSWQEAEATIVPVPVDDEGMRVPLPESPEAALIYVTPSHQFPLGTCMSLARRLALLEIASQRKLWIIEDDYDAEFRYTSAPQPSLQSLDEHRRVIYLGSFSKTLFPALRLGYVVLPPELVEPFARLKMTADDQGPLLDQATLAAFLESGAFSAHLRRCRRVYAERQELFLDRIARKALPLNFKITGRGMNLAGHLEPGHDDCALSARLAGVGMDLPPLSRYAMQAKSSGFLFGLTGFETAALRRGIETLAEIF